MKGGHRAFRRVPEPPTDMTNAYADLTTLKSTGVLNISGTGYDTRLRELLEAVSRLIDRYCNRHFWVLNTTRRFDGDGTDSLLVPDLLSVTSLRTDDDKDRTFETAWAAADYLLYPPNAEPAMPWGRPYGRVLVDSEAGNKDVFTRGHQTVQIQGKWGFRDFTADSGAVINQGARFPAFDTTLTVTDGSKLAVGETVLIRREQLYVTSISTDALTVQRRVNGTIAAVHTDGSNISVYRYPAEVVEACLLQTLRLWKRKDSGLAGSAGLPRTSIFTVSGGLDPDVRHLLGPYRKPPTGGAAW